jgi:hypothetical protein
VPVSCFTDPSTANPLNAVQLCQQNCCNVPCQTMACNPVTNEGCNAALQQGCDSDMQGGFICYLASSASLCQACTPRGGSGQQCNPGTTCVNGQCAAYCCDDGDCGPMGTCDMTLGPMDSEKKVGVCLNK